MKAVRATLVFLVRWLPILAAAALVAWDFWGKSPFYRHREHDVLAVSARDGRLHVLNVKFAPSRKVRAVSFDAARNSYRIELSNGALSGPFIVPPPPLLSPSLGFQSDTFTTPASGTQFQRHVIPEWPIVVGLAALPSSRLLLRGSRRRRRKLMGHCVRCGYDLQGATGSCPACGNVAPTVV